MSIDLDRQFIECTDERKSDPDQFAGFGNKSGALGWEDLLRRRRIVLLAEAGSGKTTEMKARAESQRLAGKYSFYATVEDVGRKGVQQSLRLSERTEFSKWQSSDKDAWLFIDSVDEAKQSGVRLPTALRALAEAISGVERRAHIVISGRYTDWQFRHDLNHLKGELAIPPDDNLPPPPTPDELVIRAIHAERSEPPPSPEEPLVVVMAGLDEPRVRKFAAGKNVENLDTFVAQLEAAGLWQFARRPLDLDWLVQFWHSNRRLGALAEMLEICIGERLQEPNLDRAHRDSLDEQRAYHAMERIGAAMVLTRRETISVPDAEIDLTKDSSLIDLGQVLPDWSVQDRGRLLTRAVFDPATLGRARIHNDNQGSVRSFLAGRWLRRLRQINLSKQALFDLLFGEQYGIAVIKPSMQNTAAWLSIWDEDVAREVTKREPFLLLDTDDPATLSVTTRERILAHVLEKVAAGDRIPSLDNDSLKRFSRPDLARSIQIAWKKHGTSVDIRRLLLRIIWLGEITECADIAAHVALDPGTDHREALFAGRALMATADSITKDRYGGFVNDHAQSLSSTVLWNAADELFPRHLSVDDLLAIIGKINISVSDGGLGFDWYGPKLVSRISSKADLEKLLSKLLTELGGTLAADDRESNEREKAYFPTIAAAADSLLALSTLEEAPLPAIDAAVRLGESLRLSRIARERAPDVTARLQASTTRRRLTFWRFAERVANHRMFRERPANSLSDLQIFGWALKLTLDDVPWLLSDAPGRSAESERELAINAALTVLHEEGRLASSEQQVRDAAGNDPIMNSAVDAWFKPREKPPELIESEREFRKIQSKNAIERASNDQAWVTFATQLRNDPTQMFHLRPTVAGGCDAKLFHLWSLLDQTLDNHRHSISTVAPLEAMIGIEAAKGFRLGLIAHWRAWKPWIRSNRSPNEQGQIRSLDSMGLAGIGLESADNPDWASGLTSDEAQRAAEYATLELNGFPIWISDLASVRPSMVRDVLAREAHAELDLPADAPRFGVLQDLAHAKTSLKAMMGLAFLFELESRLEIAPSILSNLLDVIVCCQPSLRERVTNLLLTRFEVETMPARESLYFRALFSMDGKVGTDAIFRKLDRVQPSYQAAIVQRLLPSIFGRQFDDDVPMTDALPLSSLERLVRLAFEIVRIEDDNVHPSGVAYSPDARDDAENARGVVFSRLLNTPGRAGFNAIMKLTRISGFPISMARLRAFAKDRAAKDADSTAWSPSSVIQFEKTFETEPRTPRELQLVALRRLSDMQHDLIDDDFQQGRTLAGLPNENSVQRFVADRLRLKQGQSYSIEREVHVAGEKEPDVRFRAKATDASVALEIKVAESWTLSELEIALTDQLCGKYLRARDARYGILLLVHQRPKPRGWTQPNGGKLTFAKVVKRLEKAAVKISGLATDTPQPEISTIDVTVLNEKAPANSKRKRGNSRKAAKTGPAKGRAAKRLTNGRRR
jgi:hypothetical protein